MNGFFPGLTAKHILANAAAAVSRDSVNALHAGSNDALFQRVAAATRANGAARDARIFCRLRTSTTTRTRRLEEMYREESRGVSRPPL